MKKMTSTNGLGSGGSLPILLAALVVPLSGPGDVAAASPVEDDLAQIKKLKAAAWDGPEVAAYLKTLPEKRQQQLASKAAKAVEKGSTRIDWRLAQELILRYRADQGALQPFVDGRTWVDSERQAVVSLGSISWCSTVDEANAVAEKTGKPIMSLATETPG